MARRSRPSFNKRQKEMARQQKQQNKRERRQEKRQRSGPDIPEQGEDPAIAGIRPGPQPPPNWLEPPPRKP